MVIFTERTCATCYYILERDSGTTIYTYKDSQPPSVNFNTLLVILADMYLRGISTCMSCTHSLFNATHSRVKQSGQACLKLTYTS